MVCVQSGLLSALIATQLLRACWAAARPVLPGAWVVCLVRVFQLMGNAATGASGALPPPLPPLPLSTSRSLGVPTKAVLLRTVIGLDGPSAAKILGKRPGAVRVAAHRGLKTLGRMLDAAAADAVVTDDAVVDGDAL